MTETLQAVYDVNDGTYRYESGGPFRDWATKHGVDVNDTYRIEIHLLDCLFARVFQYDRNEYGCHYCHLNHDHTWTGENDACEIAVREPYDVPISSMPPGHESAAYPPVETPKSLQVRDTHPKEAR